ncbi:chromatin segregation and condensation protein Rec8/ScpA/Scc1 (kleisin family) [Clostridium acetobutylicum]|nr:chromatin segregation and condensation protein Rec8/ScpA/Scc1 (kleisin family) [Clostridium acetobutylicum]
MTLNINIDNFQGPFDLLLHLIRKNKMDIYDIKIFDITNQYIQYLNEMKEMDLEITSEFIVMAATLIEIKSKYLLPKTKEEEEEKEESDPTKELVSKLVEYKKFKLAADFLKNRELDYGEVFSKKT